MKKKVLAFLLASTMVIEPFSVASAADFSDGMGHEDVQFNDDAEDVPEIENNVNGVDQFSADAVGEGESSSKPSEDAIQMGDDVWFTFDDSTGTATISGKGDMWDYYDDGYDTSAKHKNPFLGKRGIKNIIFSDGITSVSSYLYRWNMNYDEECGIEKIVFGRDIKKIGDYAFVECNRLTSIEFPDNLEKLGEGSFSECAVKEIAIPNNVNFIGKGCFYNCEGLKKVTLSNKISEIPDNLFSGCNNLEKIKLPSNLKRIGYMAFGNCKLSEIDLPISIENIDARAFSGCKNLTRVTIPSTVKEIGSLAFAQCTNLLEVNFLDEFAGKIGEGVFAGCVNLEEVVFPVNVQYIGRGVVNNCIRLKSITINGTTTKIDLNDFYQCRNLEVIKGYDCSYAKKNYNLLTEDQKQQIKFESLGEGSHQFTAEKVWIKVPNCTEKGSKAYTCEICGFTKDEEEIPAYGHDWNNGVVTKEATETEEGVRTYTCRECNATKTETIPKLSAIKFEYVNFGWNLYDKAYINCRTNKTISYYITTVDKGASAPEYDKTYDTQLSQNGWIGTNISMPDKEVDIYIFAADDEGNHTYYKVTLNYNNRPQKPSNTVKVGDNITATIDGDTITFSGSGTIYDMEDMYNGDDDSIWFQNGINTENIKHVIFKENGGSITRIGNELLEGFRNLEDVKLPEGLLEIGRSAFGSCNNLKAIDLPKNVKLIEQSAFSDTSITTINWPEKAISIPASVFSGTNLKEFSVPEGVTEIDLQAFWGCTELSKITIPKSVTYIGSDAFMNCRNLTIYGYKDSAAESYAKANTIKFISVDYKVIFKDNGRTQKTEYVTKGQNATPPTLPAKDGYTLSWDADYTNIQEDMVINAVWTKKDSGSNGGNTTIIVSPSETNKYTVTFKDRGKIVKTEKVKSGDAAEYPFINRNGYELSWDKDFSKVTADITVNAVWTVIKPNKVTSLTAESGKKSIALSWDETEYAGYYLVYRKADSEKEYTQVAKTTKILWTDSKAVPGTQYSYKVVAVRSLSGKKYQGAESDVVTTKIGTPQIGDTYSVGDLNYKLTGTKEVTVTGLAKVTDTLVIPSSVTISGKVYKVTSIQAKAFYRNEDIVNVTIGNNVTYIGKYSFYQCPNLETVKFGKRVSVISTCAFTQCPNLESVILPASVKRLGAKVFYKCNSIRVIQIESSALEYVGKKGLAINKSVTLKLPKKSYSAYQKLIKASSVYAKTKFVKF